MMTRERSVHNPRSDARQGSQPFLAALLQGMMQAFHFSYAAYWEYRQEQWHLCHEAGHMSQSFTLPNIDPRYRVHVALPEGALSYAGLQEGRVLAGLSQIPSLRYRLAAQEGYRSGVYLPVFESGKLKGMVELLSTKRADLLPELRLMRQELSFLTACHGPCERGN